MLHRAARRTATRSLAVLTLAHLAVLVGALDVSVYVNPAVSTIKDLQQAVYTRPLNYGACVRLLHASGVVGCAAPGDAPVEGPLALAGAATAASSLPQGAVAVVAAAEAGAFLQRCAGEDQLRSRLGGVLLLHSDDFPGWNPAAAAPLAEYALYNDSAYAWNPPGTGAILASFPFPVFQLDNVTSPVAVRRAQYNDDTRDMKGALNVGRLDASMWGAGNSTACLAARTCLPLGGYSVWAALPPLPPPPALPPPAILALAGVDTGSLFHGLSQAADSPLSGLVAMLAAAQVLGSSPAWERYQRRIVFAAMMGEPWGLMGSRRMLFELSNGSAAVAGLSLDSVQGVLEFGQVGRAARGANGSGPYELFMHTDRRRGAGSPAQLEAALTAAALDTREADVEVAPVAGVTPGLPPSSSSAFLRVKPSLPAVVLTEFDESFVNGAYQSQYDTVGGISAEAVTAAAVVAARALHALALGSAPPAPLAVNYTFVGETVRGLLECMAADAPGLSCPLAAALMTPTYGGAVSHYIGILNTVTADPQDPDPNVKADMERFIWNLLAVFTSPDASRQANATAGGAVGATAEAAEAAEELPRCREFNASSCPPGTVCAGARSGVKGFVGTGVCLNATVRYVPAWSASLACQGCNGTATYGQFRWAVTGDAAQWDEEYGWPADPLWAESNWASGTPTMVMFLRESPGVEYAVLGAGLAGTAAAAAVAVALHLAWAKRLKRD